MEFIDRTVVNSRRAAPCYTSATWKSINLTGASTAYHLAKRGIHATIFEATRVGDGASGRTGGIVLEGTAAGVLEEVDSCVRGLEALVAEERIDCDLSLPGCWEIEHRTNDRMLPWNDGRLPVCIARSVKGGIVEPAVLVGVALAIDHRRIIAARCKRRLDAPADLLDNDPILADFVIGEEATRQEGVAAVVHGQIGEG